MNKYEVVIGLEVHAQLKTKSKMFCTCNNMSVDAEPNTNVCPVCLGMPGMLPVANKKALEWTYLLGMALGSKIPNEFNFERKNYFYPDLPKAYQITSSSVPPVIGGTLDIEIDGNIRTIRIHHVHLEEDAGKLTHPSVGGYSLVDLNRAGTPLMEVVTEPVMRSPLEARIFMQDFRSILRYLGVSDANMEQGNLRCDANISLRPIGQKEYGTKVEIKNMNSFRMIERAMDYEVIRQTEMLEGGEKIVQETRGWDEAKGKTTGQRSKEEANDYRYFPEPDLPPINLSKTSEIDLAEIKSWLPELPKQKKDRFVSEYGLSEKDAFQLTHDFDMARYFEQIIEQFDEVAGETEQKKSKAKKVSNWINSELVARLNTESIADVKITPENFAKMIEMIESGEISGKMAKEIFTEMFASGKSPADLAKELGVSQISDTGELSKIIEEVLTKNEKSVNDYKAGKQQAFGFLVGQVMAATKGQANPKVVNEILSTKLEKGKE